MEDEEHKREFHFSPLNFTKIPQMQEHQICPHCKTELLKEYKRKFKCPACRQDIFLLRSGKNITFVTSREIERIIAMKRNQAKEMNSTSTLGNDSLLSNTEFDKLLD
jgi:predicted RNA-binding Zn-ribbon protein involved in translation (DUF1610 family)